MSILGVDILENDIIKKYPKVLDILLCDRTTNSNIIWATDNYQHLGDSYAIKSEILPELITGLNGNIIMPRVQKDKLAKLVRVKNMATDGGL